MLEEQFPSCLKVPRLEVDEMQKYGKNRGTETEAGGDTRRKGEGTLSLRCHRELMVLWPCHHVFDSVSRVTPQVLRVALLGIQNCDVLSTQNDDFV